VAVIIFAASLLVRGTQAVSLLRGTIVVVLIVAFFATMLDWIAFRWLLNNVITAAAVALPVIFQPELRRALERLGRTGVSSLFSRTPTFTAHEQIIDAICAAAGRDSDVTPQLMLTVFWPKTELHDGAVIIRNGRVASAASVLPLSSGRNLTDRKLGTRHRAGLGISEISDALCVIVSEETGRISVASGGRMIRRLDANRLRTILNAFYTTPETGPWPWSSWLTRAKEEVARLRGDEGDGRRAA
jgi:diadenylate cyclase